MLVSKKIIVLPSYLVFIIMLNIYIYNSVLLNLVSLFLHNNVIIAVVCSLWGCWGFSTTQVKV